MAWNIPKLEELSHSVWRCTACGTCKAAYDYGPPPHNADICPAGTQFGFEGFMSSKGKIAFARGVLRGELEWDAELADAVYKCTICGGCQNQCQLDHKPYIIEIIEALRREAVEAGAGPMPTQKVIVQSLQNYNNPYQGPRRVRTDWTRKFRRSEKPVKTIKEEAAPVLYFVGCTGAYNRQAHSIPQSTASIFNKLGVDFAILGEEEICCGSTPMRLGEVAEFTRIAEQNLETFRRLRDERGVETIVTSCAGCFRAIKKDYALFDGYGEMMEGIEVVHTIDFLHRKLKEGELELTEPVEKKVTYHDPCHTGRHLHEFVIDEDGSEQYPGAYLGLKDDECLYEQPRELLEAIPGLELVEMGRNRANSFCCGGGGGVMTGFGDWAAQNAARRVAEGASVGAEEIVSICPFCYFNLTEGSKREGTGLKLRDLTELIDASLPEPGE
ncbi:MAG: (Fe-S)-binding protein [Thermoleophilia bacterium]